jgi:hypothetical protein
MESGEGWKDDGSGVTLEIGEPEGPQENIAGHTRSAPPETDVEPEDLRDDLDNEEEYVPEDELELEDDDGEMDEHAQMLARREAAARKKHGHKAIPDTSRPDELDDADYLEVEPPRVVRPAARRRPARAVPEPEVDDDFGDDSGAEDEPDLTAEEQAEMEAIKVEMEALKVKATKRAKEALKMAAAKKDTLSDQVKAIKDDRHSPWAPDMPVIAGGDTSHHSSFMMGDRIRIRHPQTEESIVMALVSFSLDDETGELSICYGPVMQEEK